MDGLRELALRICPPGGRSSITETRARIERLVAEWFRPQLELTTGAQVEKAVATRKTELDKRESDLLEREAALRTLRQAEMDYIGRVESIVRSALEYVHWCNGHGTQEEQSVLWRKLEEAVSRMQQPADFD